MPDAIAREYGLDPVWASASEAQGLSVIRSILRTVLRALKQMHYFHLKLLLRPSLPFSNMQQRPPCSH